MTATRNALAFARPVLTGLVYLNLLYALGILALLVAGLVRPEWATAPVGFIAKGSHPLFIVGLRSIMVVGLVGAAMVHLLLSQLHAIVHTVRQGDPFIAANARRLTVIAWCVLAGEGLRWIVIAISSAISTPTQSVEMGGDFSFAPWLAVLLLFVLAGVFAQGARMRADLEGTV